MKIKKRNGKTYFVFESEDAAWDWEWFFVGILRMRYYCFGAYMNAFGWR